MNANSLISLALPVTLLAICALSLWLNPRGKYSGRARLGLSISVVFIGVVLYVTYREATAADDLERYVRAYPHVTSNTFVPDTDGDPQTRTWIFVTPDPPADVVAFYREENNRPGWTLDRRRSDRSSLTLTQEGLILLVAAHRLREETRLIYLLKPKPAGPNEPIVDQ